MELLPNNFESIEGWCSLNKALKIMEITDLNTQLIVEIGVFAGKSLLPLALKLKSVNNCGKVIGIDPWTTQAALEGTNAPENDDWWSKLNYEYFYKYTQKLMKTNNVDTIVQLMRKKGEDCVNDFNDETISILHIDGNHSEETSTQDVDMWHVKICKGGYIIFDDTNWPSTINAQELLLKKGFEEKYVSQEGDKGEWKLYQRK